MNLKCTVVIQQEEDWFVATCLENSIASQGKTIDGALQNLQEALCLYYEDIPQVPNYSPTYVTSLEMAV
jgi:predicted RNase H-like HicB family nuclease